MPRSNIEDEPSNSESSRCAAGKEAGVEYKSASLLSLGCVKENQAFNSPTGCKVPTRF
jgi:hypothetical protein